MRECIGCSVLHMYIRIRDERRRTHTEEKNNTRDSSNGSLRTSLTGTLLTLCILFIYCYKDMTNCRRYISARRSRHFLLAHTRIHAYTERRGA